MRNKTKYFSKKSAERLAAALLNRKENSPMIDARKFWTMCRLHDWFYMMSDDPAVYRNGEESLHNLERIMSGRPDLYRVYEMWREHHYEAGAVPPEPKLEV